jgi:hypothetical protein
LVWDTTFSGAPAQVKKSSETERLEKRCQELEDESFQLQERLLSLNQAQSVGHERTAALEGRCAVLSAEGSNLRMHVAVMADRAEQERIYHLNEMHALHQRAAGEGPATSVPDLGDGTVTVQALQSPHDDQARAELAAERARAETLQGEVETIRAELAAAVAATSKERADQELAQELLRVELSAEVAHRRREEALRAEELHRAEEARLVGEMQHMDDTQSMEESRQREGAQHAGAEGGEEPMTKGTQEEDGGEQMTDKTIKWTAPRTITSSDFNDEDEKKHELAVQTMHIEQEPMELAAERTRAEALQADVEAVRAELVAVVAATTEERTHQELAQERLRAELAAEIAHRRREEAFRAEEAHHRAEEGARLVEEAPRMEETRRAEEANKQTTEKAEVYRWAAPHTTIGHEGDEQVHEEEVLYAEEEESDVSSVPESVLYSREVVDRPWGACSSESSPPPTGQNGILDCCDLLDEGTSTKASSERMAVNSAENSAENSADNSEDEMDIHEFEAELVQLHNEGHILLNEPCPCGSDLSFEACHFALLGLAESTPSSSRMKPHATANSADTYIDDASATKAFAQPAQGSCLCATQVGSTEGTISQGTSRVDAPSVARTAPWLRPIVPTPSQSSSHPKFRSASATYYLGSATPPIAARIAIVSQSGTATTPMTTRGATFPQPATAATPMTARSTMYPQRLLSASSTVAAPSCLHPVGSTSAQGSLPGRLPPRHVASPGMGRLAATGGTAVSRATVATQPVVPAAGTTTAALPAPAVTQEKARPRNSLSSLRPYNAMAAVAAEHMRGATHLSSC